MNKEDIEKLKPCSLKEIQNVMLHMLIDICEVCDKYHISYWLSDGTLLGAVRHKGFIPWDDDIDIAMPYCDYKRFMSIAEKELGERYFIQNHHTDKEYKNVVVLTKIRDETSIFIEEYGANYHQGAFIDIFVMNQYDSKDIVYKLKKECFRMRSSSKMNIYNFESLSKKIGKYVFKFIFALMSRDFIISMGERADRKHKQQGDRISYGFCTPMSIKYSFAYEDIFPLKKTKFEGFEFSIPNHSDSVLKIYYNDYMKLPEETKRITHSLFYGLKNKQ